MELYRKRAVFCLDPRIKILMSLILGIVVFLTSKESTMLLAFMMSFLLLLAFGLPLIAFRYLLAYAVFWALDLIIASIGIPGLRLLFGVFIYSMLKFIPVIMMGTIIFYTIRVNDFVTAMEQMKMPRYITIPLAVTIRYLPTLKEEFGYMKETMKMRNISLSARSLIKTPLQTLEYVLVPLLLRSVKIADELSAAAITRGIDNECRRTSLSRVRIHIKDWVILVIFLIYMATIWQIDSDHSSSSHLWRLINDLF